MFEMLSLMNALNITIWVKTESETIFAIRSHYNIINKKSITCVCVCVRACACVCVCVRITFPHINLHSIHHNDKAKQNC